MAGIRVEVNTKEFVKLSKKLGKLGSFLDGYSISKGINDTFWLWGNKLRNRLIDNMRSTQKAPWSYPRGNQRHAPSTPGSFPAIDRGDMISNILFSVGSFNLEFGVSSRIPYAIMLEEGTKKMKKRPWLKPLIDRYDEPIMSDIIKLTGMSRAGRGNGMVATMRRIIK